jgi:hypothetical protein
MAVSLLHDETTVYVDWAFEKELRRNSSNYHIEAGPTVKIESWIRNNELLLGDEVANTVLWASCVGCPLDRAQVLAEDGTARALRLYYGPKSIFLTTGNETSCGPFDGDHDAILVFGESDVPAEICGFPVIWDSEIGSE